jgi:hypothetical protein
MMRHDTSKVSLGEHEDALLAFHLQLVCLPRCLAHRLCHGQSFFLWIDAWVLL